ncbi:hypothetical protein CPC08DRAFT_704292 [Agrocybe pediades]|nr:hypothetical protein CPC08DRAFT_704292 [Agrocybe pediades]
MSPGNDTTPNVDPEIPAILSGKNRHIPQRVGTWHWLVYNCYDSPDHARNTKVVKIEWYKYRKGLKHEYAVATVARGDSRYYIRIERCASDEKQLDEDVVDIEEIPEQYRQQLKCDIEHEKIRASNANLWLNNSGNWVNSRKSLASSNMKEDNRAADTALHVDVEDGVIDNEKVYLLATYRYNSVATPLYLRDLVTILNHINNSHPSFKLLLKQCYWFVRTFIGVANKRCNPEIIEQPEFHLAGCYFQTKPTLKVTINKDSPSDIAEYAEAIDKQIKAHDRYLEKKWMEGAGGKELAEDRARKEKERAEAMEALAVEERRKREAMEALYHSLVASHAAAASTNAE